MELEVIAKMGYQGYFLIVWDFINWSRNNGVPVGPGRGSAAGSLVAWALRITNLDPLPYNLLFERFLNPERVSLPDIDVDFCERNRHKTIKYVTDLYGGEDYVAQITTFGTMKAKAAVRDVGRAQGFPVAEVNRIAKLIPNKLEMTLEKALQEEPELAGLYETDSRIQKLIDISRRLEGLARHASTHAAGLVISDKPMLEYLPLYRGKENEVVSQYDKKIVEAVGLVKFDFLGLRTVTLIQDTLDFIAAQGKPVPDLDNLPLDDEKVYKLYAAGDVDGVFQVESSGMRSYLRQLRPTVFQDIIAMLALYRPGPLGANMVGEFIQRKHGVLEVTYPLPSLETCLKDTYGVIVYQEQVMQIAQIVAGYTMGGADILRRIMGGKNKAAMSAERPKFVEAAKKRQVSEGKANEIFTLMEKFGEYGFNKSHSAAYALISYYTAFLKVYYKAEFMAALLSSEIGNQDKLLKYIAVCKEMGIKVEAPTIQESMSGFSVRDGRILFGLSGIKNVGEEAVKEIVEIRKKGGPFVSLLDLCNRVSLRKVTKRVLENLIKAGAFDVLGCTRSSLAAALELAVLRAQRKQKDDCSGQSSMLAFLGGAQEKKPGGIGFDCEEAGLAEWPDEEKRFYEKEALGFYLTSHPLQPFIRDMRRMNFTPLEECSEFAPGVSFTSAVLVQSIKETTTKKGRRMAFCQVADLTASYECVFFENTYADCRDLLKPDALLELTAQVQQAYQKTQEPEQEDDAEREIKLEATRVRPLPEVVRLSEEPVELGLSLEKFKETHIDALKDIFARHSGKAGTELVLYGPDYWCRLSFPSGCRVQPGPELNAALASFENSLEVESASY
jgi:DNA polymerase-3 subunit alpha